MCCKKKSYFLVKEKGQGQMLMSVEGQCHLSKVKNVSTEDCCYQSQGNYSSCFNVVCCLNLYNFLT